MNASCCFRFTLAVLAAKTQSINQLFTLHYTKKVVCLISFFLFCHGIDELLWHQVASLYLGK